MISQNPPPQATHRTARFVDPWPWLALLSGMTALVALVAAPLFSQTLFSTRVTVEPDDTASVTQPFTLKPQVVGALRVEVRAEIPSGQWLTYEIQLRDRQDQVLAGALKSAWHESGTWQEGGESGTWRESDVRGGLDVQSQQPEEITLAIAILDYTTTTGQPIETPVNFSIEIRSGVIDIGYLWPGVIGSLAVSWLAFQGTRFSGRGAIAKKIDDSDVSDRAILGGPNNLVRAEVKIRADETAPIQFKVKFWIRDGNGFPVYSEHHRVKTLAHKNSDGEVQHYTAHLKLFFVLETIDSYGFAVEVMPDGSVDRTTLSVVQQARSRLPVQAITIPAKPKL